MDLREKISRKQDGWANGHDGYMIVNVNIDELLKFLDEINVIDGFSDAEFSESDRAIMFDGNGDRYKNSDLLQIISKEFPDAVCYYTDYWEEISFDCIKNGKPCNNYGSILIIEDDAPDYVGELYVSDISEPCFQISLGCGCLDEEDIDDLIRISMNGLQHTIENKSSCILL